MTKLRQCSCAKIFCYKCAACGGMTSEPQGKSPNEDRLERQLAVAVETIRALPKSEITCNADFAKFVMQKCNDARAEIEALGGEG